MRTAQDREHLLATAEALLSEWGLDPFTVENVIERSGVSVGAFYRAFPGKKHELLTATQDRVYERLQREFIQALEPKEASAETLAEAVDHTFGALISQTLHERRLYRAFMILSALDRAMLDKFRELNAERREAVVAILARHRQEIRHSDPDWAMRQAYHMYLSTVHGRLVFYGPGMRPVEGVSDDVLFTDLLLWIRDFLLGSKWDTRAPSEKTV